MDKTKAKGGGEVRSLLAVFSCHVYNYTATDFKDWFVRKNVDRISGIRDSWLKDVKSDYRIFKGRTQKGVNCAPKGDEIFLDAPDDYHHSAEKLRALLRWALDHGYDKVCKVDDDVYVYYDRLMANVPTADYVGSGAQGIDFCPGFSCWYSRKAMETLLRSPAGCWAEDRWAGESLKRAGIRCTFDNRYHLVKPTKLCQYISDMELYRPNNWLTFHSASPDQMRRLYADRGNHAV
jgi:hypothetical protein